MGTFNLVGSDISPVFASVLHFLEFELNLVGELYGENMVGLAGKLGG